jgi:hypothetical protein
LIVQLRGEWWLGDEVSSGGQVARPEEGSEVQRQIDDPRFPR